MTKSDSKTTFTQKATAVRVAKKMGLKEGEFEVKLVGKGKWEIVRRADEPQPVANVEPAVAEPAEVAESGAVTGEMTTAPVEVTTPKFVVVDYADKTTTTEPAPTPTEQPPAEPKPKNKSTLANPTKAVWAIADEMKAKDPNVTRKQVVEECVRRGVALYTAKTQYQRWMKAKKATA